MIFSGIVSFWSQLRPKPEGGSFVCADIDRGSPRTNDAHTGCLAQDTGNRSVSPMDALSDLLRVVRLKGGVFLHAEFTAPWCIFSQITPEGFGPLLVGAGHLVR